jgi:hypothetical protein
LIEHNSGQSGSIEPKEARKVEVEVELIEQVSEEAQRTKRAQWQRAEPGEAQKGLRLKLRST